ncbi:MAG: 1-acyl-sn-glycerol-3-phosphate acyltransferase, partial [Sinobacteraceae bacterium]|nr:1-acyl-sn-glycerol-3-phosphate acyltransferase [Nevskiaceae bacterium]
GLLQLLHVRIRQRGHPPTTAHLMVANHVSWLDISIIVASVETRFVSKAEVRSWPLAGWLATAAGTFYLQRGAGKTRTLVWALRDHLRNAGHVTIFPEGTTTEGERLLRFQSRLFAAAIDADCGVQPIALSYGRAASGENIAAFVGQQSLVANLWRLLQERELTVEVTFCTPLAADHADRGTLALSAHCAIAAALELTAPHESVQATPLAA